MTFRTVTALCLVLLSGCHGQVVDSGRTMHSAGPTETIGIETTQPQLVDGVNRVDTEETVTATYTPEQISQLPIGQSCTVKLATDREIRGRIAQTSKDILVLSEAEEVVITRREQGVPMLDNVPYVQRMFKNVGIAVESRPLGTETLSSFEIRSVSLTKDSRSEQELAAQPQTDG